MPTPNADTGVVKNIKELVVQVVFLDGKQPSAGEVLVADNPQSTWLLVHSFIDDTTAQCINLGKVQALQRGMAVKRTNKSIEVPASEQVIGRILDALGQPIDGKQELSAKSYRSIFDVPAGATAFLPGRVELLETGLKVIDFFTPFVKGRKVGIVGGAGVGKTVLTMELIHNVAKSGSALAFFTGIGERIREGHELYETLRERDLLGNTCMFFGQMNENPAKRALVGLSAATLAEYFRDEHKKDVLFFVDNIYRFVQANNELSSVLGEVPSEGGYEPTIFSDIKRMQDRLSSNKNGSITAIQTIYVPADDLNDPAVQLIQHELDSVIVLSRHIAEQGIRPAVDLIRSSSSLLDPTIVGERHYLLSVQVQKLLQKYESLKNIITIIGENELSPSDRADYAKATKLITFFSQDLFVTEDLNGRKGEYFTREQTLKGVEEIIV